MRALTVSALALGLAVASSSALAGNCAKRGAAMGPMAGPYGPHPMPAMQYGHPHSRGMMMRTGSYGSGGYGMKGADTGYGEASPMQTGYDAKPAPQDIVDIAASAGSFDTLVTAVKAAGLVDTLKGEGPFTVFAPTDDAFAKIPKADLEALLADKEALIRVLTYHVVPGKVLAADVGGLESAQTVQGQSLSIDTSSGVKVDGANVVKTDILASNGVIHVIDSVVMPN